MWQLRRNDVFLTGYNKPARSKMVEISALASVGWARLLQIFNIKFVEHC
ncbi:hypothetical protein LT85_2279 [Collimonas arenae]|uniref:Uncharacterized protein n=1 Tax=Collimonas arenae TaxID=279058 RepID=A0A0A1FF13_9BURK|nr:hypothetical protein LT85_2279 [Collimonas arenae]